MDRGWSSSQPFDFLWTGCCFSEKLPLNCPCFAPILTPFAFDRDERGLVYSGPK